MNIAVLARESRETAANAGEVELIASVGNHPVAYTLEPEPVEIDPRPCTLCGLLIDRHEMVDDGEGPEHYCPDPNDLTLDELERRAELVRQIEVAAMVRSMELNDPRDAWRHTGEPPPPDAFRNGDLPGTPAAARQHYRTPPATANAFWLVIGLCNPGRLKSWLGDHPKDAPFLLKLLEGK
jgi:hypothetical protein